MRRTGTKETLCDSCRLFERLAGFFLLTATSEPSISALARGNLPPFWAERSLQNLSAKLYRGVGNFGVASLFLLTLLQVSPKYGSALADWIWLAGTALMAVFSLIRLPANSVRIRADALLATGISIVAPLMARFEQPSIGTIATVAIGVELFGVIISQLGMIYLGRRFALLPANRGVVTGGPFGFVRHPTYAGWLILSIGSVMAHPSARNLTVVFITAASILWRITEEESLLVADPVYICYRANTRWRLVPLLY